MKKVNVTSSMCCTTINDGDNVVQLQVQGERNVGRVGEESGGREGRSQVVHRRVESEDLDIMPAIYSSARLSVSL